MTVPKYDFQLFVTGHTPRSEAAIRNLRRICDEALGGECRVEVVDVLEHTESADREQVLVTPTLIKRSPLPAARIAGDLSDAQMVLGILGLEVEDGGFDDGGY